MLATWEKYGDWPGSFRDRRDGRSPAISSLLPSIVPTLISHHSPRCATCSCSSAELSIGCPSLATGAHAYPVPSQHLPATGPSRPSQPLQAQPWPTTRPRTTLSQEGKAPLGYTQATQVCSTSQLLRDLAALLHRHNGLQ